MVKTMLKVDVSLLEDFFVAGVGKKANNQVYQLAREYAAP